MGQMYCPTALLTWLPAEVALVRVALTELTLAWLSVDRDESTLSTELVAVKDPVVTSGVVPARVPTGVVDRPSALLRAVLTALLVTIAGVTEGREVVEVGELPGSLRRPR